MEEVAEGTEEEVVAEVTGLRVASADQVVLEEEGSEVEVAVVALVPEAAI